MLGDTDAILGSVPQNASIIQGEKQQKEKSSQMVADKSTAPGEEAGRQSAVNDVNQITITPQMAKGLKQMTGQSWDQTVGTKWKPEVFTAVTTGMAQAKYHQDVISGRLDIQSEKDNASKERQSQKWEDAKELENIKSQHKKEIEELKAKHAKELKGTAGSSNPKSAKEADPQTQGRQLLDAINKATKSGDGANKKSAVDNYNKFAGEHGLSEYKEEPGFLEKVGGVIKSLAPKGGGSDKISYYMKKNGIKDTPANRKWAEGKVSDE